MKFNISIIKKLSLILIILISIITLLLISLIQEEAITDTETLPNIQTENEEKVNKDLDNMYLYNMKKCIQLYIDTLENINIGLPGVDEEYINNRKQYLYSLLSQEYIDEKNITTDNIYSKVNTLNERRLFILLKARENEVEENVNCVSYIIQGTLIKTDNSGGKENIYLIATMDLNNNTFSIIPIDKNYSSIEEIETIKITKSIEENEYNLFRYSSMQEDDLVQYYFNEFKTLILNNPEYLYNNILEESYKKAKFETSNNFIQYINSNIEKFKTMLLEDYQVKTYEKYKEYVCVNQYGDYIIFQVTSVLDYNIILDTYTINLERFIETYNKSSEQEKVVMNIERIFKAINDKDYRFVYNYLDENFKNNYFKDINTLSRYIETNLYNVNNVKYEAFSSQGEIFIYQIKIKNEARLADPAKEMTIIMKLKEETDFEMSFSII